MTFSVTHTSRGTTSHVQPSVSIIIVFVQSTMMFARQSTRALASASFRSTVGRKQLSTSRTLVSRLDKSTSIRRTSLRHKSTAAAAVAVDYDDEIVTDSTIGHAAAAQVAVKLDKSHEEAWMANLGRGNDNEWLSGPRPEEWFTGIAPSNCPGKSIIMTGE